MIPFGPWHPDKAGINTPVCREAVNCLPSAAGYRPARGPAAASGVVDMAPLGAINVLDGDGAVHAFCGTSASLYKLATSGFWSDVSRASGGDYSVTGGERWSFATYGDKVIATALTDDPQKFTLNSSVKFSALGGTPPRARYVAVVRDFVLLGNLYGYGRRVQWSGLNNEEHWTPGALESDYQDLPDGGPVRGLLGGDVAYIFQAAKILRMTYIPGSVEIFDIAPVETSRGLLAPGSLTQLGALAFYLGTDGLYRFDCNNGVSTPLGVGKWANWLRSDIKGGSENLILAGIDPSQRIYYMAYVPVSSTSTNLTRLLAYDWSLDEASIAADGIPFHAISQWLTSGVTLDTMDLYGSMETLPFSLDSPFWSGGSPALGVFTYVETLGEAILDDAGSALLDDAGRIIYSGDSEDGYRLSYLSGETLAANWVTADGQADGRQFISATRPAIDTDSVTVAIASRERDADPVVFDQAEALEDTGEVPAVASGNIARARIQTTTGSVWTLAKGLNTLNEPDGFR